MKYMDPLRLYQELLKPRAAEQGRILGLNVGDKLVGLAISDSDNKLALPLGLTDGVLVRDRTDLGPMVVHLQHMVTENISKEPLSAFVVGYPFGHMRAAELRQFVNDLSKTGKLEDVHYTFWDDAYCTKSAESFVKHYKFDPTIAEQHISQIAAVSVLQGYLDYITRHVPGRQDK